MRISNPLKQFPREIQILTIASFFVAVGFGVIVPAIPFFARTFGVSNTAVGLIVSTFAIARLLSGFIAGPLVDRFGERIIYAAGLFIVALSMLFVGLAQSYWQLLIFRAAGGLGSMMFSVAAGSVIYHSVDDSHRARAQALYNGSFVLGGIAGPAIGGVLIVLNPRTPFFFYGALLLVAAAVAYFFLRGNYIDNKDAQSDNEVVRTVREVIKLRPYQIAITINFIWLMVAIGLRNSTLTLFMTEEINASSAVVGLGFTLSAGASAVILMRSGRISDLKGRRYSALIGASISLLALCLFPFMHSHALWYIAMAIFGFGGSFIQSVPTSMVGDMLRGKGGRVIAFLQMSGDAGAVFGPILLGAITDRYGFSSAFAFAIAVFLIAVIAVFRIPETRNVEWMR